MAALLAVGAATVPGAARAADDPPAGGEAAGQVRGEYRIGADDLLSLRVFGLPELDQKFRVRADGTVVVPLVGEVEIAGLTLPAAEDRIALRLVDGGLAREPQVVLYVEEYNSRTVTVQGAVRSPGAFRVLGEKTLLDLLGEAGGLTGREAGGAAREIYVLRRIGDGSQRRIVIDGQELIDRGDPSENIFVQPGDVILVPHASTERVYVDGAVNAPGPVLFVSREGITLLQAIIAAGGTTDRARLGRVHVLRRTGDGGQERIEVDVKKITKGKAPDLPLEDGDVVVVDEWFF